MSWLEDLRLTLQQDEGTGPTSGGNFLPYNDSMGKLTIGFGYNLEYGLPRNIVEMLLDKGIADAVHCAQAIVPGFDDLDDVRKSAFTNMAYNLGHKLAGFMNMLAAVGRKDWESAAAAALDSQWATQVGLRARRLAEEIRTGEA